MWSDAEFYLSLHIILYIASIFVHLFLSGLISGLTE